MSIAAANDRAAPRDSVGNMLLDLFDSCGIGRTNGETPSSVEAMGQAATNFITALDYPKVDVLGWSLGGFIAQQVALDKPEMINKLVVAGSGPGGVAEAPWHAG